PAIHTLSLHDALPIYEGIGIVSLVGAGMKTHPGIAAKMFATLAEHGINLQMIATSPIKISCVIPDGQVHDAVRCLHDAFELAATDRKSTRLNSSHVKI